MQRRAKIALAAALIAGPLSAQSPQQGREVNYLAQDGTPLSATLSLPEGAGPHPGVVVLSIAGTDPLVDHLVGDGYAVLTPMRRGFVAVEPLLQATYADLAGDARSALAYLAGRDEVDAESVAMIGQADDAPPAMLAVAGSPEPVPLVLLAPPAFPGVETFLLEQRAQARSSGARPEELAALDAYVRQIAEIVLNQRTPFVREYQLEDLRAGSRVQLPRNAAFPDDERQMHFFASPLWHDRLAFEPEVVLALLRSPVIVLIGDEEANTPMDAYLEAVRAGLSAASTPDASLCRVRGRTRHVFNDEAVATIGVWLASRVGTSRALVEGGPLLVRCEDV